MYLDRTLLLLLALLVTSLGAFLADVFPYPFGFIILTVFIVGRILYLRGR